MGRNLSKKLLALLALVLVANGGCARYKKSTAGTPGANQDLTQDRNTEIPGTPGAVDPLDPSAGIWSTGGTAVFVPESDAVFNDWVASHPVDPENLFINVALKKVSGKSTYTGAVKIRYKSGTSTYEANLKTHTGTYNGSDFYRYNYWFNSAGTQVFSGFLEDQVGAIVLVIDDTIDLGDGGGATQISGEVWYRNFTSSWASYYEGASWSVVLPCWFRSIGPYDCRSSAVINKSSLYPSDTYRRLGTFSNMNKLKAFAE